MNEAGAGCGAGLDTNGMPMSEQSCRAAGCIVAACFAVAGLTGLAGCGDTGTRADTTTEQAAAPAHIDSILPIEEEIRRFRATIEEPVTDLGGFTARGRNALVTHFIEALEQGDSAGLAAAALTRAEFAYLYYPHTKFTAPPYELPPAFVWFQIEQNNAKGLNRVIRSYGSRHVTYRTHTCPEPPRVEGPNRIWESCTVDLEQPDGAILTRRLFGSILERDGRFKFVSFANDL